MNLKSIFEIPKVLAEQKNVIDLYGPPREPRLYGPPRVPLYGPPVSFSFFTRFPFIEQYLDFTQNWPRWLILLLPLLILSAFFVGLFLLIKRAFRKNAPKNH